MCDACNEQFYVDTFGSDPAPRSTTMTRRRIAIDTGAYTRTHGHAPYSDLKGMWAVTLDGHEHLMVRYGSYTDVIAWAKTQAQTTVKVWP
jgi:hypothetical protein